MCEPCPCKSKSYAIHGNTAPIHSYRSAHTHTRQTTIEVRKKKNFQRHFSRLLFVFVQQLYGKRSHRQRQRQCCRKQHVRMDGLRWGNRDNWIDGNTSGASSNRVKYTHTHNAHACDGSEADDTKKHKDCRRITALLEACY